MFFVILGEMCHSGNNDINKYCVRKYFTLRPCGTDWVEITIISDEKTFAY